MKAVLRSGFIALAMMLAAACSENAGPYENGLAAYQRGDYATALKFWRPLAEQGLAVAQNNLGVMYEKGRGVLQDYAEAVKWYRKAAEQGYAEAQSNLGFMYDKGEGVTTKDVLRLGDNVDQGAALAIALRRAFNKKCAQWFSIRNEAGFG